ncbi:MAG TPA: serine/threonine-protein kinase [Hyalangium sp.]|nr:serine/threonine-protein kinase [Hyalangium sp.]
MNGSMSRQCSQCGEKLPEGAAFCPRDGTRVEDAQPFSEPAATVRRSVGSGRGSTAQFGAAPASQPSAPTPGPSSPAPRTGPVPEDPGTEWEATVARDVLVGKQLDGYVVKRRIGDGGMGIVYEGEHPVIGRKVAIKILRPELTEGNGARDLIAEARAASAIRHRGIIDIFGFGTLKGIGQYLVMEFLEGIPLNKIISQRAPMPETEVIALMDELLAALAAAHAVGVIHRDLKPGNIFVERDSGGAESLKVLDFGLAKRSEVPNGTTPQTRSSLMVGTPEYMAPEQAVGNAVGPYTDLYAAGLIAYELLTRRLPFEGATPMALVIQHVQKEPPPPSSFVEVHPALDALVLQMLAKEPSQRPASAEEVRRELRRILQQISQGEPPALLASTPSLPRAEGEGEAATVVRPTPSVPTSAPRAPTSAPSYAPSAPLPRRPLQTDLVSLEETQGAVAAELEKGSQPNRRGLIIGGAAAAAVVLAALGGWMMRGAASDGGALPAGPAPAAPVAAPALPPPSPPPSAPVTTPEIKEPGDILGTPPEPQPEESGEDTSSTAKKAAPKMGTLQLVVRGTGTIRVNGKVMGTVPPLNTLSLPAGEHKLEVINLRAQPYSAKITITAGKRVTHRVKLIPRGTSETP